MRIDLLAPPFRGHLHPILAIARELAVAHEVRVVSTPAAAPDIAAAALPALVLLDAESDARLEALSNPPRPVKGVPWRLTAQFREALTLLGALRDALEACYAADATRPELLIADFTLPVAGPVAARHGMRWWTSLPSPCVLETRGGPPAYVGGLCPRPGVAGTVRDGAARVLTHAFKRGLGRLERRRLAALGFPAVYRVDGTEAAYSPECVLALGLESLEFGRGWPAAVRFVGPRLYTPPSDAPDPPFRAGGRHVLMTGGTHLRRFDEALTAAATALARARPDLEIHLSAGRTASADVAPARSALGTSRARGVPPNLARLRWVDYARHVRRYALVVHHGGSGILGHCLAAGVPAVVLPRDFDQFDNAARLAHAGLAFGVRSEDELTEAVSEALDCPALARRCAMLPAEIARTIERHSLLALLEQAPGWHRPPLAPRSTAGR